MRNSKPNKTEESLIKSVSALMKRYDVALVYDSNDIPVFSNLEEGVGESVFISIHDLYRAMYNPNT